jgi:hypothetical protein
VWSFPDPIRRCTSLVTLVTGVAVCLGAEGRGGFPDFGTIVGYYIESNPDTVFGESLSSLFLIFCMVRDTPPVVGVGGKELSQD